MFAAPGFIVQKGGSKGGGGLKGGGVSYLGQQEPAFRKGCKMEKKSTHTQTYAQLTQRTVHM